MELLLWILSVIIGLFGVGALVRHEYLWGALLIILAFLVGPGGVSLFT